MMEETSIRLQDYTETRGRSYMKIRIVDFLDDLIRERMEKVADEEFRYKKG